MKNFLLGLLTLGVSLIIGFSLVNVVYAQDRVSYPLVEDDPKTWEQCSWSWSNEIYPIWGETYCQSSCGAHSLNWLLVKSKIWSNKKNPKDIWEHINGKWSHPGAGGYTSMATITIEGNEIKNERFMETYDVASLKSFLTDEYNKGHYAMINVPGHFIALDYVDDSGNVIVLDSAGSRCRTIECAVSYWGSTVRTWTYSTKTDNKKDGLKLHGGDNGFGGGSDSSSDSNDSDSNAEGGEGIVGVVPTTPAFEWDEDMIPNMPTDRDYKDENIMERIGKYALTDINDKVSIDKWKTEILTARNLDIILIFRRAFALVSIILLIIAGILPLIYVFDIWNPFGFSIISFVTFGAVKFAYFFDKDMVKHSDKVIIGPLGVFVWSAVFAGIGGSVTSGWLFEFVMWILNWLNII